MVFLGYLIFQMKNKNIEENIQILINQFNAKNYEDVINKGNTLINISLRDKNNYFTFQLKNKRNIDRKSINLLRNKEISAIIS